MTNVGSDALDWIDRIREVNRESRFTASQRSFIDKRLEQLYDDLQHPIPFVEGR